MAELFIVIRPPRGFIFQPRPLELSPSAACRVILQPILLGTCLNAYNHYSFEIYWKNIALRPLDFEQSKQLVMVYLLSDFAWIQLLPIEAERFSFLVRLFETVGMQGALEMGGGVPGVLKAAAQVQCLSK